MILQNSSFKKSNLIQIIILTSLVILIFSQTNNCAQQCLFCSSSTNLCSTCSSNFYITLASPPTLGCLPCPNTCKMCTSQSKQVFCTACAQQYYSQPTTNKCLPCEAQYCIQCDQFNPQTCITCFSGYYLIDSLGICQSCSDYQNTLACRQNFIQTCKDGFYSPDGTLCQVCMNNCLKCSSNQFCSQCASGYYGNSCQKCETSCLQCSSSNSCSKCAQGKYIGSNGLCSACVGYPTCIQCNLNNQCIKCYQGYYFNSTSNNCLTVSLTNKINKCLYYSSSQKCSTCETGYFLTLQTSNGPQRCSQCSLLCKQCSGHYRSSKCLSCNSQAYLIQNGTCQPYKTSTSLTNIDQKYFSSRNDIYLTWGNFQSVGTASNSNFYGCEVAQLFQQIGINIGSINGYEVTLKIKILIKPYSQSLINNQSIIVKVNQQKIGTYNPNPNQYSQCGSVFTDHFNFTFSNSLNILLSSNNLLKINSLTNGTMITISQLLVLYKKCHKTCSRCLSWSECIACKSSNSTQLLEKQKCVSTCSESFNLYSTSSSCLKTCPDGTYSDITIWVCKNCPTGCATCQSQKVCLSCKSNYFLDSNSNQCVTSCPIHYYPNNLTLRCNPCQLPCLQCQSAKLCKSCKLNFFQSSTKTCISDCGVGYYRNFNTLSCQKCVSPCVQCKDLTTCTKCQSNLTLNPFTSGQSCLQTCPTQYISIQMQSGSTIYKECKKCYFPCLACSQTLTNCTKCQSGYLFRNNCITTCPTFYYQKFDTMTCQSCQSPCQNCVNYPTQCTSCLNGYILENNQCLSQCSLNYYKNTDSSGRIYCHPCPSQCLACNSSTQCQKCSLNYYLYSTSCLIQCPLGYFGNYTSRTCDKCQSFCSTCKIKSNYCTTCLIGYQMNSYHICENKCKLGQLPTTCQPCQHPCSQCISTIKNCTKCLTPFFLMQSFNTCVEQCYYGYYPDLVNLVCLQCVQPCIRCSSSQQCQQCGMLKGVQYYLSISASSISASCIQNCPKKFFAQTKTHTCIACSQPCLECVDSINCLSCVNGVLDGTTCISNFQCPPGKYKQLVSNSTQFQCLSCRNQCLQCISLSNCSICKQGLFLQENVCISQCSNGLVAVPLLRKCQVCQYPCQTCSFDVSNCTKCKQSYNSSSNSFETKYYLWLNQCLFNCPSISYPEGQYCKACVSPCLTCNQKDKCTSCAQNYYFLNGQCLDICPATYFKTPIGVYPLACRFCIYPCKQCLSESECLSCQSGILYGKQCLLAEGCPIRYYRQFNNDTGDQCVQCSSKCQICYQKADFCLKCSNVTQSVLNGICRSQCPSNYYKISQKIEFPGLSQLQTVTSCKKCNQLCTSCLSSLICTNCINDYYLYQGFCFQNCPNGHLALKGKCYKCQPPCVSCINTVESCISCQNNLYLYQASCVAQCPIGSYLSSTLQCRTCQFPCSSCQNYSTCQSCLKGYFLDGNVCRKQCTNNGYIDKDFATCLNECPQNQYVIQDLIQTNSNNNNSNLKDYKIRKRCSATCNYPYLKSINAKQCLNQCPQGYYINSNLQCALDLNQNSNFNLPSIKPKIYQDKDSSLILFLQFSQKMSYNLASGSGMNFDSLILIEYYPKDKVYALNNRLQNNSSVSSNRLLQFLPQYNPTNLKIKYLSSSQNQLIYKVSPSQILKTGYINIKFNSNSHLLIKSVINTIPLQKSNIQTQISYYVPYQILTDAQIKNFRLIGEVLIDFTLLAGILLLIFNRYSKIYSFLHIAQLFFSLALLNISYPTNLWQYLQGFKWGHLYQFDNWFNEKRKIQPFVTPIQPYDAAGNHALSIFGSTNFIVIAGHTIPLYVLFGLVAFCLYLMKFILRCDGVDKINVQQGSQIDQNQAQLNKSQKKKQQSLKIINQKSTKYVNTLKNINSEEDQKITPQKILRYIKNLSSQALKNYKWSYINDIVFTLFPITLLAFVIQTDDYSANSILQILGILISFIMLIPQLGYLGYMIYKIHKLRSISILYPKKFAKKDYLGKGTMTPFFQGISHPASLYKNYLHIGRIISIGFIAGFFYNSPGVCLGIYILQSVFYAFIYLSSKPYSDKIQNLFLGFSQLCLMGGLVLMAVIYMNGGQVNRISEQNLWIVGWACIVFLVGSIGLVFIQAIINVLRGNTDKKKLQAQQQNYEQIKKIKAPKKILVEPKIQFEGWQYERNLMQASGQLDKYSNQRDEIRQQQ